MRYFLTRQHLLIRLISMFTLSYKVSQYLQCVFHTQCTYTYLIYPFSLNMLDIYEYTLYVDVYTIRIVKCFYTKHEVSCLGDPPFLLSDFFYSKGTISDRGNRWIHKYSSYTNITCTYARTNVRTLIKRKTFKLFGNACNWCLCSVQHDLLTKYDFEHNTRKQNIT